MNFRVREPKSRSRCDPAFNNRQGTFSGTQAGSEGPGLSATLFYFGPHSQGIREEDKDPDDILNSDPFLVREVVRMVDRNEYKRRQAAPGLKITPKASAGIADFCQSQLIVISRIV